MSARRRYRLVVITGAAGGIGQALSRRFLAEGYRVVLVDRRGDQLARVQNLSAVEMVTLDVTDTSGLRALADNLGPRQDGPDVIINNAAVHSRLWLPEPGNDGAAVLQSIDQEIRTNFTAVAQNCAIWLPYLLARPEGAAIVNIASALAFVPKRSSPIYCASKAALQQFSLVLGQQLKGTRVSVVTVFPPLVSTAMTTGHAAGGMSPDRFAGAFYRQFAAGRQAIRVGNARWQYWLSRLSPKMASWTVEP